jgi:hypothetical protein
MHAIRMIFSIQAVAAYYVPDPALFDSAKRSSGVYMRVGQSGSTAFVRGDQGVSIFAVYMR